MHRRRWRRARGSAGIAVTLLLALFLSGCGSSPSAKKTIQAPPASPVHPAPPPRVGACYLLNVAAALQLSSSSPAVPCRGRHTAVTVAVGHVNLGPVGHRVPIDAPSVQRQIAASCRAAVARYAGGNQEARRLSRIQAVWFSPSAAQSRLGAHWYRCDLVAAGNRTGFSPLPARSRHLLAAPGALTRFGTCGTAAPGTRSFARVGCTQRHRWRARASIDLPAGTRYLSPGATKKAGSRCRDIEARRAVSLTRLRWSFEWPTRAEWASGQRYGLCWTPDS